MRRRDYNQFVKLSDLKFLLRTSNIQNTQFMLEVYVGPCQVAIIEYVYKNS